MNLYERGRGGQVTLPKRLREVFGLEGGEIVIHEETGKIVIENPTSREEPADPHRDLRPQRQGTRLATTLNGVNDDSLRPRCRSTAPGTGKTPTTRRICREFAAR